MSGRGCIIYTSVAPERGTFRNVSKRKRSRTRFEKMDETAKREPSMANCGHELVLTIRGQGWAWITLQHACHALITLCKVVHGLWGA